MIDIYEIVRGPLLWIAFFVFLGGIFYNIFIFLKKAKRDPILYGYLSFSHVLKSYFFWFLPYGSYSMRKRPLTTLISYSFHIGLLLVPIFFLGHIELWKESWGIEWYGFPNKVSDALTLLTIFTGSILFVRRLIIKDVKYLSTSSDYFLLLLVILVFLTGFLAKNQLILNYKLIAVLHILLGELMLILIPFTRLSHIIYFWFIRAHTASEFGKVRRSRDY